MENSIPAIQCKAKYKGTVHKYALVSSIHFEQWEEIFHHGGNKWHIERENAKRKPGTLNQNQRCQYELTAVYILETYDIEINHKFPSSVHWQGLQVMCKTNNQMLVSKYHLLIKGRRDHWKSDWFQSWGRENTWVWNMLWFQKVNKCSRKNWGMLG